MVDATFVVIPIALLLLFAWALKRTSGPRTALLAAIGGITWMTATWAVAQSGILRAMELRPPPFLFFLLAILGLSLWLALGPLGRQLSTGVPLYLLVAVQSFRLPLELAMHELSNRGIMPIQMSYSGRNFDILTGATAILLAIAIKKGLAAKPIILAWNIMGLALLINVVTVAILSTPIFRYFGNDRLNVFVTYPPYVWLPAVMVLAALSGHILLFRALK